MEGRAESIEQIIYKFTFMSCIYDCHFLQLLCCIDAREDTDFSWERTRERELGFGNIAFTVAQMLQ